MKIEEITFNKLIGTLVYIQLLNVVKMKKSQFQKRFSTYYIVFRILYVYFTDNDEDLTMKNVWKETNISV